MSSVRDWLVQIESVGGVDAARRVQDGEPFDAVVLASDAIDKLMASGATVAGSKVDLVHSPVAVAVRAGAPGAGHRHRGCVAARGAGRRQHRLFDRPQRHGPHAPVRALGHRRDVEDRLVQAPPGVPVGTLVASGDVALGFQQLSELIHLDGITVVGPAARGRSDHHHLFGRRNAPRRRRPRPCAACSPSWHRPRRTAAKRRHGMEPA